MSDVLKVVVTSILPYLELRGAIPLACGLGFSAFEAYLLAVVGNMIPVVPIMIFFDPATRWCSKFPLCKRFFDRLRERNQRHAPQVQKYGFWGLALFVAVPLPMTGAWSGAAIAFLLGMRKRIAFASIFLGVLIAGIIVTILTYGLEVFVNWILRIVLS